MIVYLLTAADQGSVRRAHAGQNRCAHTGREFSLERRSDLRLRENRILEGIALRFSGELFQSLGRLKRGKRLKDWSLIRGT